MFEINTHDSWPSRLLSFPDKRPPDKKPPSWFFTMRKLACQTIESIFKNFNAKTLSHAASEPFACTVLPAMTEQHLLMTCSTEYRKIQLNQLNKLKWLKLSIYLATWVTFIWIKNSAEKTSLVAFCPVAFCPYTISKMQSGEKCDCAQIPFWIYFTHIFYQYLRPLATLVVCVQ